MKTLTFMRHSVGFIVFAWGLAQAQAATVNLNLTGTIGQGQFSSFIVGANRFDQWQLVLGGLGPANAITLSDGDSVSATVALDQSYTVPASVNFTSFGFTLKGSSFPPIETKTSGIMSVFNNSVSTAGGSFTLTSTTGRLAHSAIIFPPANTSITFDSLVSDFTITQLSQSVLLDGAEISYTLSSPVPEPAIFAMMLAGLALLGLKTRRS